jgi:hypothetical protein
VLNIAASVLVIAVVVTAIFAIANAISEVNPPALNSFPSSVSGYALEPQQCKDAGITPSSVRTNSAPAGDTASQLILGGGGGNTLRGRGGDDCILGGGGRDNLYGEAGYDVCIGGSGNDYLDPTCEVQIP